MKNLTLPQPNPVQKGRGKTRKLVGRDKNCLINEGEVEKEGKKIQKSKQAMRRPSLTISHGPEQKLAQLPQALPDWGWQQHPSAPSTVGATAGEPSATAGEPSTTLDAMEKNQLHPSQNQYTSQSSLPVLEHRSKKRLRIA